MNHHVTLINPPYNLEARYGKDLKDFGAVSEPLGLAYLAAYLESKSIPVNILDSQATNLGIEEICRHIQENRSTVIGITVLTPAFNSVRELCGILKNKFPEIKIVLGGPHCTALPERTLEEIPEADIACIGEGEVTFHEVVTSIHSEEIIYVKGICLRDGDDIIKTAPRPFVQDLDIIPIPARHLLPMHKYRLTASRVSKDRFCPTIIIARGCPFSCTYCSHTFGKTFRPHSIERILNEIKHLIAAYNISQLNIEADTLTVNKRFVKELCLALISNGIHKKIKWTCESRVDTVDEEMLQMMKRAGCWQISYGVETGNQRLLDMISKSVTLEKITKTFQITKKVGISIRGFFMLGLPTESAEESRNTISYAKKLDPMWAQFTLTVPYPGTNMFAELDRAGQIKTYNWSKYNTWWGWKGDDSAPFIPAGRTVEELQNLQKKAMKDFYLRPKAMLRFMKTIESWDDICKYWSGLKVLIKNNYLER